MTRIGVELGYLNSIDRLEAEIERLRAALKPFAELGQKWAPHCAPNKAIPPDASAERLSLDGLKVSAFVEAFRAASET
jgi:hypothetical protein